MNSNIINDENLIYNTSKRIPICICVDASTTQANVNDAAFVLSEIKKGIENLCNIMGNSDMTRDCAEIALVSFANTATVLQDFSCINTFNNNVSLFAKPTSDGSSNLGNGLHCSLELINTRKQVYNAHGVDYYQPWLVVISDSKGISKENKKNITLQCKKTLALEKSNKLIAITINIMNDGVSNSSSISQDKSIRLSKNIDPQTIGKSKIAQLFEWLGKSIDSVAFENEIKLDLSGLTDWEDI